MALVRYSAIVAALSGNIGNLNFVHTKSGPVVRKARKTTRQTSTDQLRNQSFPNIVSKGWNALTDAQRQSFQTAAVQVYRTNPLGFPKQLSGRQLYFALRLRRLAFGDFLAILRPPTQPTQAPLADLTISDTAPSLIEIDWTTPASLGVFTLYVYGARSFSTTPSKFFSSHKALGTFTAVSPPLNIFGIFFPALGVPSSGELISVKTILGNNLALPGPPTLAQGHMA